MLTSNARKMIEQICLSSDKVALEEIIRIAQASFRARTRRELEGWVKGQKVEVRIGRDSRTIGTILSINQSTITVDLGRRKIRVSPNAIRQIE